MFRWSALVIILRTRIIFGRTFFDQAKRKLNSLATTQPIMYSARHVWRKMVAPKNPKPPSWCFHEGGSIMGKHHHGGRSIMAGLFPFQWHGGTSRNWMSYKWSNMWEYVESYVVLCGATIGVGFFYKITIRRTQLNQLANGVFRTM